MRTLYTTIIALLLMVCLVQTPANAQYRRHDRGGYRGNYSGRYYTHYNNYGYRPYRNYGYYPYIGSRGYLNRPSVILSFGGYRYNYLDGIFYRPYGSYFRVVMPPIGIHIGILPHGYSRVWVGPSDYYYYQGIFYRPYNDYYEVVTPPVGAEVAELPQGARTVVIDNKKYYQFQGTYYKETIKSNGEIWYTVTGKQGVLSQQPNEETPSANAPGNPAQDDYPEIGSRINNLPEGSKTLVLNNHKYFVSPDDVYYQEVIENNQILYKVVEKPTNSEF
jgi:hypothetical protein